jgi:hypothetical protein
VAGGNRIRRPRICCRIDVAAFRLMAGEKVVNIVPSFFFAARGFGTQNPGNRPTPMTINDDS